MATQNGERTLLDFPASGIPIAKFGWTQPADLGLVH
jgi:hypothetical protein